MDSVPLIMKWQLLYLQFLCRNDSCYFEQSILLRFSKIIECLAIVLSQIHTTLKCVVSPFYLKLSFHHAFSVLCCSFRYLQVTLLIMLHIYFSNIVFFLFDQLTSQVKSRGQWSRWNCLEVVLSALCSRNYRNTWEY